MNHQLFGQALASLSFTGRCPAWFEYENGSPAEQRAIAERWSQIVNMPNSGDFALKPQALKNYSRYCAQNKPAQPLFRPSVEGDHESAQARFLRGEEIIGPDNQDDVGL